MMLTGTTNGAAAVRDISLVRHNNSSHPVSINKCMVSDSLTFNKMI